MKTLNIQQHRFNAWVVIRRAEDVQGAWVAHCLDFDIVSQGSDLQDALRMIVEALSLCFEDDLRADRLPPMRPAPDALWQELLGIQREGVPVGDEELKDDSKIGLVALQLQLDVLRVSVQKAARAQSRKRRGAPENPWLPGVAYARPRDAVSLGAA